MSSRNRWWALVAGAMIVATLPARATGFRQTDYAYAATLDITGAGPVYTASLPLEVYRSVAHADLTDICVVNASGEVVPFAIRRPEATRAQNPRPVKLPLFPLLGNSAGSVAALRLRLRDGATAIDIERPGTAAAGPAHPSSYLIDARATRQPLAALLLGWEAATPDFSGHLQIDASDDLEHWRPAGYAQIISLHYAGQGFVRNEIAIHSAHTAFLRLTWTGGQGSPVIDQVEAIRRAIDTPLQKLTFEAAGSATARPGEFAFDLGARLPAEEVNLLLPERNSVVQAEFLIPLSGTREWQPVTGGRIYDLALPGSTDLLNEPISIAATPQRQWRVRISEAGGGIGNGLPRLEVSWVPSEVVFLARGTGPFRLLYGNAEAPSLALTPDAILNPTGPQETSSRTLQPGRATLEPPQLLGGPMRLTPAAPLPDWKRWILWATLLLGVAVLAFMSWRLLKTLG